MPQDRKLDENGNVIWRFDICIEFDCNEGYAETQGCKCGGDFTKEPCLFLGEHIDLNEMPDGGVR